MPASYHLSSVNRRHRSLFDSEKRHRVRHFATQNGILALEGLVAQHLRAWSDYSVGNHRLHYWQTRLQVEVDFVVYGESGLYALEVKNSTQVRSDDLRALKNFAGDYPQSQRNLVYRGKERFKRDDILCLPADGFLLGLRPGEFQT